MLSLFALSLLSGPATAAPPVPEPVPFRGAPTFALGIRGTTLALVEHADGSLVLRVGDPIGSTTCALPDRAAVGALRDLLRQIEESWFHAPNQSFSPLSPAPAHRALPVCELTVYTRDFRVFLQAVRMDAGLRTDIVTAELSPIRTSHTVVDRQVVQRAEDNADALRAVQVAGTLVASGAAVVSGGKGADAAGLAALFAGAAVASGDIEDTATRYLRVIEAHTDLALALIVLDAYLYGGHLPRAEDIEAAYRIRTMVKEPSPAYFCRSLARLASGRTAADILLANRACADAGTPAIACLP